MKGVAYVTVLHTALKIVGVALILGVALYATGGIAPMVAAMPDEILHLGRLDRRIHHHRLDCRHRRRDLLHAVHRAGDLVVPQCR